MTRLIEIAVLLSTVTPAAMIAAQATTPAASQEPNHLQLDLSADDYPAVARRQLIEGTTSIEVRFGRSGEVTTCKVTASAGFWALDDKACSLAMARGRRMPPGDREPSVGNTVIAWRLPGLTAGEREIGRGNRGRAAAYDRLKASGTTRSPTSASSAPLPQR